MAFELLIHSLLTAASALCAFWCAVCVQRSVSILRASRHHLNRVEAIDERITDLERGQDRHTESLQRMNGRIGAMVAKNNQAARLDDTQPIDDDETNADREGLYRALAERSGHG